MTRCDAVLGASGELTRAYQQLTDARARRRHAVAARALAERHAKLATVGGTGPARAAALVVTASPAVPTPGNDFSVSALDSGLDLVARPHGAPVAEVVDYLEQQWHALVRADNLLGPVRAISAVREQVALIEQMLRGGAAHWQARLWGLGAQYAESAAWLHEDLGDHGSAVSWTSRALEWAHAAGDPAMISWALFRRSQQAASAGDTAGSLALVQAAGRDLSRLQTPMRAAILQQQALGLALARDEHGALTRLDEAMAFAAPADLAGDAAHGHGSFCTVSYLQMQRANCWMSLGRPDRAVPAYREALTGLPEAYHRDRGHGLARLGRALAARGEVEEAAAWSTEAMGIGVSTGSVRILREVRNTLRALDAHAAQPAVAALAESVSLLESAS